MCDSEYILNNNLRLVTYQTPKTSSV